MSSHLQTINGSFTPTLKFGGGNTGMTYTVQQGQYVKIANIVYISGLVTISAKGSSTGTATIENLPFAAATVLLYEVVWVIRTGITPPANYTWPSARVVSSSRLSINVNSSAVGGIIALDNSHFVDASSLSFSGYYTIIT